MDPMGNNKFLERFYDRSEADHREPSVLLCIAAPWLEWPPNEKRIQSSTTKGEMWWRLHQQIWGYIFYVFDMYVLQNKNNQQAWQLWKRNTSPNGLISLMLFTQLLDTQTSLRHEWVARRAPRTNVGPGCKACSFLFPQNPMKLAYDVGIVKNISISQGLL